MVHDGTTAQMVVGMVGVTCPACGLLIEVDVRVASVSTRGGSYLDVKFQPEQPEHRCTGRRS